MAQRVPPELFKDIILYLVSIDRPLSRKEKREIGQCSLVCRYWEQYCRSLMFENITLRSFDEAQHLLDVAPAAALGVRNGSYIRDIAADAQVPSRAWIHLPLYMLAPKILPYTRGWTLSISGAANASIPEKDRHSPRSAFFGLPRSLPVTHGPSHLKFTGLRFRTFSDLVSFVASFLPSAFSDQQALFLELHSIDVADRDALAPDVTPPPFRGAYRRWQKRIEKIQTSRMPAWPLVWLMVTFSSAARRVGGRPLYIQEDEARRMASLVDIVISSCNCFFCWGTPERDTVTLEGALFSCLAGDNVLTLSQLQMNTCSKHLPPFTCSCSTYRRPDVSSAATQRGALDSRRGWSVPAAIPPSAG